MAQPAGANEPQWELIPLDQQFMNFSSFQIELVGAQAAPTETKTTKATVTEAKVFDKRELQTKTINLRQIDFWFKQGGVFCKDLTMTDTGLAYSKYQVKGITFLDFLNLLEDISSEKDISLSDVKTKLQACGLPGASKSTKGAPTNA